MITKKCICSPLLVAMIALGCHGNSDTTSHEEQASTLLQANMLSIPPEMQGELEQGEFELRCDGSSGALASSKLKSGSVDFTLKAGTTLAPGNKCYVNVLRPDLPYNPAAYFPIGTGIYWASTKEPVYTSENALKIQLRLFKAYSLKLDAATPAPAGNLDPAGNAGLGVSAAITVKGDCRVFSADRTSCLWDMPNSCKVPSGEMHGTYEHQIWLTCAADAATATARLFHGGISGTAPAPMSPERRRALEIIESLQMVQRTWNQTDPQQRADLIDRLLADGRSVTSTSADANSLRIRDEAVVYGIEAIILPVLGQVKAQWNAGVPAK